MPPSKNRAPLSLAEIKALHDRVTDQVAYLEAQTNLCKRCATALLPESNFCHRCGRRVIAPAGEAGSAPADLITVKLHGLYDEKRREELALALIPILADIARTIDMKNVEHIDLGALTSLIPLLDAREAEHKPPIEVIGMNDDVYNTLTRAKFAKFFQRV